MVTVGEKSKASVCRFIQGDGGGQAPQRGSGRDSESN